MREREPESESERQRRRRFRLKFTSSNIQNFIYFISKCILNKIILSRKIASYALISEVTCAHRDPRSAGSNPAEVDGFFQDVKILSTSPPGRTLSWGSQV